LRGEEKGEGKEREKNEETYTGSGRGFLPGKRTSPLHSGKGRKGEPLGWGESSL